jgi:tripartite-type tricarboxylate transporter receptor subunit TctC
MFKVPVANGGVPMSTTDRVIDPCGRLALPCQERRAFVVGAGCALAIGMLGSGAARAQDYPLGPIKMIVAYGAGGANDIIARIVGKQLGQLLGQPVLVINVAGAGGMIGAAEAARAAPDGYSLLMAAGAHALAPSLYKKLPYNVVTDFAPVGLVASGGYVLSVNTELPVKTVAELIAHGKRPGVDLRFVSGGVGVPPHLAGELLRAMSGASMIHVPYKSEPESINDLIAGRVEMGFITVSNATPMIRSGRLRGLAISAAKRSAILPELPTLAESGFPDFDVSTWWGVLAPANTPQAIVLKLHAGLRQVVEDPQYRDSLVAQGMELASSRSPQEFAEFIKREKDRYGVITRTAGIVPQ